MEFPDGTAVYYSTLLTSLPAEYHFPITSDIDCFSINWQLVLVFSSLCPGKSLDMRVISLIHSLIQQILKVYYGLANILDM